jgi:hypothetical protein
MDSRLSDPLDGLRDAAQRGDWPTAQYFADLLARTPLPADPGRLAHHLARLQEALIFAKASRANATATLLRLRAAARFNHSALGRYTTRQNPGESTVS